MAFSMSLSPLVAIDQLPDLLNVHEAAGLLRIPHSSLYAASKAGTLPAPIALSPRRLRWRKSDLVAVINGSWQAKGSEA